MQRYKKIAITSFVLSDYFTALLAWASFFVYRKLIIEGADYSAGLLSILDVKFLYGILFIPLCWLLAYLLFGTYTDVYRKSRLAELYRTLGASLAGAIVIFFVLLLDDVVIDYRNYYKSFTVLFTFHFLFTFTGRFIILNKAKSQLEKGKIGYSTLIIGGNKRALELYNEITGRTRSLGYKFVGFIDTNGNGSSELEAHLPKLGRLKNLERILRNSTIDEVIIAVDTSEHHLLNQIINVLGTKDVAIKIIPDMYDILSGSVKMNHVLGAVLIEIYPDLMPQWERFLKRIIDVSVSIAVLIMLSPIYLLAAIMVKLSSHGSILYTQKRIGLNGKPFNMYKFRSMVMNAEQNGPLLSHNNDKRITSWGKIMRKWRLDEFPQFYNVLKGEMSLVGPRPERGYYVDKIIEKTPHYRHVHKVKPGITSWGMVQFGYAENIDQMIERMKYDLLYIENMSMAIDLKIMIYTVLTILRGKGK